MIDGTKNSDERLIGWSLVNLTKPHLAFEPTAPNTVMTGVLDTATPSGDVHSPFKQPALPRLARVLSTAYGIIDNGHVGTDKHKMHDQPNSNLDRWTASEN